MTIITQTSTGAETDFKYDYIYNFILANSKNISSNKKIIVYSSNRREKQPTDVNPNDILIHLSNENLKYNYHFLHSTNTVLRSYYHPFILKRNCYAIPLGWQTGFGNHDNIIGTHEKYMWCFIGQIKGYRKPMYDAFQSTEPGFASISQKWNSHQLTDDEVKQVYLDSSFALVPFGSIHADTMRIMEVMEYGCIPVVIEYLKGDYYKYIFGNHPFIIGKNWEDARIQVVTLWNDKDALSKKQQEVDLWYKELKQNLQADVTDILKGKKPTRCQQWKYQRIGHYNIKMLLIWYYHFYFKKQPIY